jgi:hypothetical protein
MKKLFKRAADILLPASTVELFNAASDMATLEGERLCLFVGTAAAIFIAVRSPRYARAITNFMQARPGE